MSCTEESKRNAFDALNLAMDRVDKEVLLRSTTRDVKDNGEVVLTKTFSEQKFSNSEGYPVIDSLTAFATVNASLRKSEREKNKDIDPRDTVKNPFLNLG